MRFPRDTRHQGFAVFCLVLLFVQEVHAAQEKLKIAPGASSEETSTDTRADRFSDSPGNPFDTGTPGDIGASRIVQQRGLLTADGHQPSSLFPNVGVGSHMANDRGLIGFKADDAGYQRGYTNEGKTSSGAGLFEDEGECAGGRCLKKETGRERDKEGTEKRKVGKGKRESDGDDSPKSRRKVASFGTDLFKKVDGNNDGLVTKKEMRSAAEVMVQIMDTDQDTAVSSKEFMAKFPEGESESPGKLTESQRGHHQTDFFHSVEAACAFSVVIAYMLGAGTLMYGRNSKYTALSKDAYSLPFVLTAFLYWIVMPATMLFFGRQATCEEGTPDEAYLAYAGFLAVHAAVVAGQIYSGMEVQPFSSMVLLLFFDALEHFDMATDAMFPGTSSACSYRITPAWLESWKQSMAPRFLLPAFEAMGFGGFTLTCFVAFAYIPQAIMLSPFASVVSGAITFLSVATWVTWSQVAGMFVALVGAASYVGGFVYFGTALPILSSLEDLNAARELAGYSGISSLLSKQDERDEIGRLAFVGSTKLIFENMLQMWIQAAAFGFSFAFTGHIGRLKAIVSIGLGLAVSSTKIRPLLREFFKIFYDGCSDWDVASMAGSMFLGLLPIFCLCVIPWLGIVAKVYYAFQCPSHVWNLSSGCVKT